MYGSVLFLGIRDKWFTRLCPRCLLILDVATFIRCLFCLHRSPRTSFLLPQLQRWEYNYKATPPEQALHCFFQSFLFSFNHQSHKISSPLSPLTKMLGQMLNGCWLSLLGKCCTGLPVSPIPNLEECMPLLLFIFYSKLML